MVSSDSILKAMADSTRQRLLGVLSLHDLSVSELVEVLAQPQSTVSRHLKVLRESGLVVDRRAGNTVTYAARPAQPLVEENGTRLGGGVSGLRDRLLDWVGRQSLDSGVRARLDGVIRRRQEVGVGFFEAVGSRWDQLRTDAFGQVFHFEALTALLPPAWTVADVGTGTGYMLPILAERFAKVIAVDPAGTMLELARQRTELDGVDNVEFREGSLAGLPMTDGEVDLLIASLVLHHVGEPAGAVPELRRCLRTGGRLMIIEQDEHHYAEFHDRMGDHWWGLDPGQVQDWLLGSGFGGVRTSSLATARPIGGKGIEAPSLFVTIADAV